MSEQNPILQQVNDLADEIKEMLKKSGIPLQKDDAEEATPPSDDMSAAPAPEADSAPEAPVDEIADQGEAAPEDGLEAEAELPEASLAEEAQSLSDEDLDALLEALMAEKQSRQPAEAPMADEPVAPEAAPPEAEPAQKSEDMSKMAKSMEALAGALESLSKKVDAIAAPKPAAKVTAKVSSANRQDAQVLHKSTPVPQRLAKSASIDYAMDQKRKGNKNIDAHGIYALSTATSDEELHAAQDQLALQGFEFPKL